MKYVKNPWLLLTKLKCKYYKFYLKIKHKIHSPAFLWVVTFFSPRFKRSCPVTTLDLFFLWNEKAVSGSCKWTIKHGVSAKTIYHFQCLALLAKLENNCQYQSCNWGGLAVRLTELDIVSAQVVQSQDLPGLESMFSELWHHEERQPCRAGAHRPGATPGYLWTLN